MSKPLTVSEAGSLGGKERFRRMTAAEKSELGKRAARARWKGKKKRSKK
jgi:hypothetical protein